MRHRVLVPAEPSDAIPRGELCAHAARQGRVVALPDGCTEVGFYDEVDGELRAHNREIALLEQWLGRRVSRGDLEARDNRTARRARARRLTFEGRIAEAAKLDARLGL